MVGLVAGPILALVLWFAPLTPDPPMNHALAISAFMIVYWIFEPIEHGITALMGCYLFWALGVADFGTAFAGFASNTPWFLFGALIIGAAASGTGVAQRIGYLLTGVLGSSYSRLLLSILVMIFVMNLLVPSGMAQVTILAPIVIGIISAFNAGRESNISRGMFVMVTYTCGLFNKMIMSGAGAILTRGMMQQQTGYSIRWSEYIIAFGPAIVLTIIAAWLTILWLYPPEKSEIPKTANI